MTYIFYKMYIYIFLFLLGSIFINYKNRMLIIIIIYILFN